VPKASAVAAPGLEVKIVLLWSRIPGVPISVLEEEIALILNASANPHGPETTAQSPSMLPMRLCTGHVHPQDDAAVKPGGKGDFATRRFCVN